MAMYVVDASVVIQYAITQTYTPEAQVLVTRMYQGEQLCIPEFCLLECVNVLWKEVRFRGLPQTQAEQIVGELLALSFRIMPTVTKKVPCPASSNSLMCLFSTAL